MFSFSSQLAQTLWLQAEHNGQNSGQMGPPRRMDVNLKGVPSHPALTLFSWEAKLHLSDVQGCVRAVTTWPSAKPSCGVFALVRFHLWVLLPSLSDYQLSKGSQAGFCNC